MAEVRYAFVLRVWFQAEEAMKPPIRGSLQPAHSDQVHYFTSLEEIPDLLQRLINWQSGSPAIDPPKGKEG